MTLTTLENRPKSYGDSFEDTTLEAVLSGVGVGRVVVVGAQTDWCVRSTLHGALADIPDGPGANRRDGRLQGRRLPLACTRRIGAGSPGARSAAECRAGILDVDRMWREWHDSRAAGENPSAFLVEGACSMIFGERPDARLLDIRFAKANQSKVVKRASDASAPRLWHHVQGLQDAVTHRDDPDGRIVLERNVRLPIWIAERREPVPTDRIVGELVEARWKHVLEARDRRSACDPETQPGVLHRGAHDSHGGRTYCGRRSSARSPHGSLSGSKRVRVPM
jgi:hypothetical protein